MRHPCEAQVAWQICKLLSELDVLLWELYWDEFEALYEKEEAEKYWGETICTDQAACQT
jgi:hypothetical protein